MGTLEDVPFSHLIRIKNVQLLPISELPEWAQKNPKKKQKHKLLKPVYFSECKNENNFQSPQLLLGGGRTTEAGFWEGNGCAGVLRHPKSIAAFFGQVKNPHIYFMVQQMLLEISLGNTVAQLIAALRELP